MTINLPDFAIVVRVGASGSGKSTFGLGRLAVMPVVALVVDRATLLVQPLLGTTVIVSVALPPVGIVKAVAFGNSA